MKHTAYGPCIRIVHHLNRLLMCLSVMDHKRKIKLPCQFYVGRKEILLSGFALWCPEQIKAGLTYCHHSRVAAQPGSLHLFYPVFISVLGVYAYGDKDTLVRPGNIKGLFAIARVYPHGEHPCDATIKGPVQGLFPVATESPEMDMIVRIDDIHATCTVEFLVYFRVLARISPLYRSKGLPSREVIIPPASLRMVTPAAMSHGFNPSSQKASKAPAAT